MRIRPFLRAGALLLLIVITVGRLRWHERRSRVYSPAGTLPEVPADAASVARGKHLAHTLGGCAECHGEDLAGRVMDENALVRVAAPNLTPAGPMRGFSDADWLRAIAHGVDRQGRSLLVMPSRELALFSDADLGAIVAYMKTLSPVERDVGPTRVSVLGSVIFGYARPDMLSAENVQHERRATTGPALAATREYGNYLLAACRGCHGPELRGGVEVHPGAPPSADISPGAMSSWTFAELERALREGKRRDGTDLDPAMPWNATKGLSDTEMRALYLALCQK
jgi:cytochrome c553